MTDSLTDAESGFGSTEPEPSSSAFETNSFNTVSDGLFLVSVKVQVID